MALVIVFVSMACGGRPIAKVSPEGTRVRVRVPGHIADRYDGILTAITSDTVTVDSLAVPRNRVVRLESYRGRRGNAGTGSAIGLFGGGTLALVAGLASCEDGFIFDRGDCVAIGALFGAGVGAVVGAITGAFIRSDRWVEIPLERLRVSVVPLRDRGLGVGVRIAF